MSAPERDEPGGRRGMTGAEEDLADVLDALTDSWTGRRVLLLLPYFGPPAAGVIDELTRFGATVRAVVTGAEPVPGAPFVPHVWSCAERGRPLGRLDFDRWAADPGPELARWLDGIDGDRTLTVLATQYAGFPELCGRRLHGWRRPEWAQWEDKVRIEDLWRAIGIPSPPHVIGIPGDPGLRSAALQLDRGHGLVVATDSSQGVWGGSRGLRWARRPEQLDAALAAAVEGCDRVRVAEFVPGVPCSVIGMALERGTAVFDPIEMVTLHREDPPALEYCGTSTRWRPDPTAAESIRAYARRAGDHLASTYGLRGMFSLDGVLEPDGFTATELNPRLSGGLGVDAARPGFPDNLLHRAVQEGTAGTADLDPDRVQEAFRRWIRATPSHEVWVPVTGTPAAEALVRRPVAGIEDGATLTWRAAEGSADLLAADPARPDGAMAPAAAALAAALGTGGLMSFAELSRDKAPMRY